jgi:Raf kinase inhibitor-like YbhB/YbcL family protein
MNTLQLTSPAFAEGQTIPARYTCDDADVSPPLRWSAAPARTRSFAVVCDDPDAPGGSWVHWVLYNLAATTSELPEELPATETLLGGAVQGVNDFNRSGYGGPCPPPGRPHRYCFRLYALSIELKLPPHATKADLLAAMKGHVLAEAALTGTYQRRR